MRNLNQRIEDHYIIKITLTLADIVQVCGIKSTGSSKIFILGIWGLREVLTRFNPFLRERYIIMKEKFSSNFNNISYTLTDIFGKKSWTIMVRLWQFLQSGWHTSKARFVQNFIRLYSLVLDLCTDIRNLKLYSMGSRRGCSPITSHFHNVT